MQIGVYGCGYLGTVVAACLADFGVPVTAYGSDSVNTTLLASGILPFHEKNLSDIVRRGVRSGRRHAQPWARIRSATSRADFGP